MNIDPGDFGCPNKFSGLIQFQSLLYIIQNLLIARFKTYKKLAAARAM